MECPEELGKALILPLTIQPLLENAIRYGMEEMMDTCEISIRTRKEGTLLIVEVSQMKALYLRTAFLKSFRTVPRMPTALASAWSISTSASRCFLGIPMDCPLRTRMRKLLQSSLYHTKTEEDDYA